MTAERARGYWKDGWYVVPYDVIFRDVDYFGHVNNAVYFTYFELARTLIWFDITGGSSPGDIGFIVARAECDFKRQVGLEPIEIAVRISAIGTTSLTFVSEIRKVNGGEIAAYGTVVVVLFDWQSRSKIAVSDELRQKVKACSPDVF